MNKLLANKYVWILAILLGLNIPLNMIEGQIEERSAQREVARQSVRQSWTGEQQILAAVMVIPFQKKLGQSLSNSNSNSNANPDSGGVSPKKYKWVESTRYLVAETLKINATIKNQALAKGIYSVPVYTAEVTMNGHFDLSTLKQLQQDKSIRLNGKPYISVGIKDSRGIIGVPTLNLGEQAVAVNPGSRLGFYSAGFNAAVDTEFFVSQKLLFDARVRLNGMETLSFLTGSKDSMVELSSDWPHPQFIGAFLPVSRDISNQGYRARWQTGLFSTNVIVNLKKCASGDCSALKNGSFGVQHIQPVDIYLQTLRAIKYGMLVVLVTFSLFVLFEIISQQLSVHPISYFLTGVALAIFFLLLVALSEHIAFYLAYWLASFCCASVIAFYVAGQSGRVAFGAYMLSLLMVFYAILFFIIRSEDHALLAGSLLLFFLLAAVMFITRKLDWFRVLGAE